jgi:hypothetical protein
MRVILDLMADTDNTYPGEVTLAGDADSEGAQLLVLTLENPYREVQINRSELLQTLGALWKQS